MPELPEVETVCRRLATCLPGLVLDDVEVDDPTVSAQSGAELRGALQGRRVAAVRRRGKYVIIEFEGVLLVVHLRMTGRLLLAADPGGRRRPLRGAVPARHGAAVLRHAPLRQGLGGAGGRREPVLRRSRPRTVQRGVHDRVSATRARGPHGAAQVVSARPAAHRRGRQHLRRRSAVPRAAAPAAGDRRASAPARRSGCTTPCSRRCSSGSTTRGRRSRASSTPPVSAALFRRS